jgi:hypothetical protein
LFLIAGDADAVGHGVEVKSERGSGERETTRADGGGSSSGRIDDKELAVGAQAVELARGRAEIDADQCGSAEAGDGGAGGEGAGGGAVESNEVVAAETNQACAAGDAADDGVGAGAADEGIAAGVAFEDVAAGQAGNAVVAVAADERVGLVSARDGVVAAESEDG